MLDKVKKNFYPKGRGIEDSALEDIKELISNLPLKRDLLIEYLHLIQDKYGQIRKKHLAALSKLLRIPLAESFEVATFYAHFDVIEDDSDSIQDVTIRVCDSLTCELFGSENLIKELKDNLDEKKVRVLRAPCMGLCDKAPACEVGHKHVNFSNLKEIQDIISKKHFHPDLVEGISLKKYIDSGGYEILKKCYTNEMNVDNVIEELNESGLKGMGGAGFPSGQKWKFVRMEPGPRLMTINGDEGEPGTFKDHHYLTRDPHRFLEGMLIAAWVVEATDVYIYMRDEYPDVIKFLKKEIKILEENNLNVKTRIHFRRGAGAYICGEESSMLESLEGKRGLPRHKPPFPSQVGLFGRPTLIHNVETVFWVREILEKGAVWFSSHGLNGRKGLRTFSVSGRVKNPGVKLAPAGITIKQLIDEYCGGIQEGHTFKAYLPGGASGGILPAKLDNIPLDFDTLQEHGCFIGSAAVVVLSDRDNMKDIAKNLMFFFHDESCGQCTPVEMELKKLLNS